MWACHIICGASPKILSLALTLISVVESNKSLYVIVELVFTGDTKKGLQGASTRKQRSAM